ncbi:MAG: TonB-dependent receptor [Rhodanobacteraceae bacterium]|nr:MAG: TonB-dependent receptor [Rhodanobacteraceae bacterium]
MHTKTSVLSLAIMAALAMQPAHAQQATTDTPAAAQTSAPDAQAATEKSKPTQTLAAITVTATKRVELMQNVPIAVNVVTAKDIQTAGLTSASDLQMIVPGLNMVPFNGPGAANTVIRGESTTIGEPNVSFFVDGVYIPSRDELNFLLADNIARVEVAEGPQFALFGQNSFAGAINFITKQPSDHQEASVLVGAGNYDSHKEQFIASGPFSPGSKYHYRVGLSQDYFGGFYRNSVTGKKVDRDRKRGAFLTLTGTPTDRFNFRYNLIYDATQQRGFAQRFVENNGAFVPMFNDNQMFFGNLPTLTSGFGVTPGQYNHHSLLTSLTMNYSMDWATLTSVTAYNHFDINQLFDADYSPAPVQMGGTTGPQNSYSEDLRLLSPGNQRFDWMLGFYYYHLSNGHNDTTEYVGPAVPLGGLISDNNEGTRSAALYGTLTWHIAPQWDLMLAVRKTDEKKSVAAVTTTLASVKGPQTVTPFDASQKFTPFTPGLYLTYKPSKTATVYASVVKAIKVGGFNTFTTNGAIAPNERAYKSERSLNYELGTKLSLLDGNMLLDMDVYRINWHDQIVRTIGSLGAILNTNAGATVSKGVEANLQYAPSQRWQFRAGLAYNHSNYQKYLFPIASIIGMDPDLAGVPLQYAPRWIYTASVIHSQPLANGWLWTTRLDGRYRSSMVAVQTGSAIIPSTTVFNLNSSLEMGRVQVSLWVDNLLNKKSVPSALFAGDPATTFDFATHQRPGLSLFQPLVLAPVLRTYGIDVRYRF